MVSVPVTFLVTIVAYDVGDTVNVSRNRDALPTPTPQEERGRGGSSWGEGKDLNGLKFMTENEAIRSERPQQALHQDKAYLECRCCLGCMAYFQWVHLIGTMLL